MADLEKVKERILKLLKENREKGDDVMPATEINFWVGSSYYAVKQAIAELSEEKKIVPVQIGNTVYWKLNLKESKRAKGKR